MDDAARAALHALETQSGSHRPSQLAEQAESLGYAVLAPRGSGPAQYVRLVRGSATLYLHPTRLAVQAQALRDFASGLPGAQVTARDVQFPYDTTWGGVLSAFVDWTGGHTAPAGSAPTAPPVPRAMPRPPWEGRAGAVPRPLPSAPRPVRPAFPVWLAVVGAVGLLLVGIGIATSGIGGGLVMAGLVVFGVGLLAVIAGHARWAYVASRAMGTVLAAAGFAAVLVGGAALPSRPASDASPAEAAPTTSTSARPSASPTPDEAA